MEQKYFSYNYYIENNEDLRKFSSSQAWEHYINFGKFEGRKALPLIEYLFDYEYYISTYDDLKSMSVIEAQDHYVNCGINEGRIPCDNYTQKIKDYEQISNFKNSKGIPDNISETSDESPKLLENVQPTNLKEIYSNYVSSLKTSNPESEEKKNHLFNEPPIQRDDVVFDNNRGLRVHLTSNDVKNVEPHDQFVFDYSFYIEKYPDVSHLNPEEAKNHFIQHGKKEGRHSCVELIEDFDYDFYIKKNPDLKNLTQDEAFTHWLTIGKFESRKTRIKKNPKTKNFDSAFYVESYNDLKIKHLNPRQSLNHYLSHGSKEGRIGYKQSLNSITNITIIIHLFHLKMLPTMTYHINNVKTVFKNVKVIFSVKKGITNEIQKEIESRNPGCYVLKVENKGTDNYPFFLGIKFLRKNKIKTDYILKLHSKLSNKEAEGVSDWARELMYPLTNYWNLTMLQHYFVKMEDIGYVSAQSMVLPKNYDLDFPQNIQGVTNLIKKFPHLERDWTDFNGGNMFWISNKVLDQYCTDELMDYLIPTFGEGKPPDNLNDKGIYPEYICERLFTGVFCYDKKNIFINTYPQTVRGVSSENGIIDHKYFYQPKVFSISIPKTLILS
tara:strand:- start:1046 stop:2875 length:1830 start_codon:yes stop_codon:yes gene_type:complete